MVVACAQRLVTKLPDELRVIPQEVAAVVTVLRLLGRLLDGEPMPN
jgi:hypothetical protein